jgi:hypothetical protein
MNKLFRLEVHRRRRALNLEEQRKQLVSSAKSKSISSFASSALVGMFESLVSEISQLLE